MKLPMFRILECLDTYKYDVSTQYVVNGTNLSRKTVDRWLKILEEKGMVRHNRMIGKTKMWCREKR